MMIAGSGTLSEMLLCGRTCPPLTNTSSFTITSSPSTVMFSQRTHRPTMQRHPIMHELSHECDLTIAPVECQRRENDDSDDVIIAHSTHENVRK